MNYICQLYTLTCLAGSHIGSFECRNSVDGLGNKTVLYQDESELVLFDSENRNLTRISTTSMTMKVVHSGWNYPAVHLQFLFFSIPCRPGPARLPSTSLHSSSGFQVELDDLHAKYQNLHDATQTKTGASGDGWAGVGSKPCLGIMEVALRSFVNEMF